MNDSPNGPWGTSKVTTNATGTTYTKLPEQKADTVTLCSTVAVEARKVGATDGLLIPANTPLTITVSGNAAEIDVRRFDQSNTTVAVTYLWRAIQN